MKKIIILMVLYIGAFSLKGIAQDIHFSQFWNTPLLVNPSFAGKGEGDMRAVVNHRSQWASVMTTPYKSYGAHFDMLVNSIHDGGFLAGGLSMYTDVAGDSKMRTTMVDLAVAYHLKINGESYVSAGIQAGVNQKSMTESDLRFGNQFDGKGHNPHFNSHENLTNRSELKPSVAGGISYMWSKSSAFSNDQKKVNIGLAVYHFNASNYYFVNPERLGMRYVASFQSVLDVKTNWVLEPAVFVALQNKATDIIFGSMFNYMLGDRRDPTRIGFGAHYRVGDALIPAVKVTWSGFSVGFSYDANLSDLKTVSKVKGGFEISLKYVSFNSALKGKRGRSTRF